MIRNHLLIAWRTFWRYKGNTLLNILSLSVGLVIFYIIYLYVGFETSFDKQHPDHDRIYRISRDPLASLAPSFTPLLKNDFPEIEAIARIFSPGKVQLKIGEKNFIEENVYFVEPDFTSMFNLTMIHGNLGKVFEEPNQIALSEKLSKKYFGERIPVGELIVMDNTFLMNVAAVFKDPLPNTHFPYHILVSYESLRPFGGDSGDSNYFLGTRNFSDNVTHTYLKLAEGTDPSYISSRFPSFIDKYLDDRQDQALGRPPSDFIHFELMPIANIHLHSNKMVELSANGNIINIRVFSIIGLLMLVIAAFNYINLNTAKASDRAREMVLKKILGAGKGNLIRQFLLETFVITLIATMLALIQVEIILPFIQNKLQVDFSGINILSMKNIMVYILIFILLSFFSGIYPAIFLSSFLPTALMKGYFQRGKNRLLMRKSLVIFQFSLTIALVTSIIVVLKQMHLIENSNLGFEKENVLLIPINDEIRNKWPSFKQLLDQETEVISSTLSKRSIGGELGDAPGFSIHFRGAVIDDPFNMPHNRVDFDFFETYGIEIVSGRSFDRKNASDSTEAFIINETALWNIGIQDPSEIIGAPIEVPGRKGIIIGVVQDFNYESLHKKIKPIVTYLAQGEANTMAIKLAAGFTEKDLNEISQLFQIHFPENTFEYEFLDQRLNQLYVNESNLFKLFKYFTGVTFIIAIIGITGLSFYDLEKRTKEIGIRKVNGAGIGDILILLNLGFVRWVIIALAIAGPVTWIIMNKWLQNFAYKTEIKWWIPVAAGCITLVIALISVSWQVLKAASRNPVEILRYE